MIPVRETLRAAGTFADAVREPISPEKRAVLERRWSELPESLKSTRQVLGRQLVHCGYTMGAAYCSFGCTHCYLPTNANSAPLPSLDEMKRQIDANRVLQGPDGGLQITGGDVVDAYWRRDRAEELVEIVRYAADAGAVPMIMTHGQLLLEHPDYLERLVEVGRLRKVAVHIDITQAGRPGYPIRELERESDLNGLRQRFVELIHAVRSRTGKPLSAAHTVTVAESNLDSIGDILAWLLADPRRTRAFRMISFQTEADVGRTRFSERPVTPEATWERICEAVGADLPRDNLDVGHPDCSNLTTLVTRPGAKALNLIPSDSASQHFLARLLAVFGGVGTRGHDNARANGQRLGQLLRHPGFLLHAAGWLWRRFRDEGLGARFLVDLLAGRVGSLNIVLHNFMSAEQLAAGGETVEMRLAACSFRGAVERDGRWQEVPMCSMNGIEREEFYRRQIGAQRPGAAAPAR